MRLDKFLKVSRVIKRRTLAKEVCDSGKISINSRVAKAGSEVKVGDTLKLILGSKELEIKVLEVKETIPAKEANSLYEVVSETYLAKNE